MADDWLHGSDPGSSHSPMPIKLAATLVPLRDGPDGPEVFLVQRGRGAAFMPGAYVFPGGRLDASDALVPARGGDEAAARMGVVEAKALMVAAVRELYEEAGLAVATPILPWERREDVSLHRLAFGALCLDLGIRLDLDRLGLWAHWLTPEVEPRRYDTWFFVARAAEGPGSGHDRRETVASGWWPLDGALREALDGLLLLSPPTLCVIHEMAAFPSVNAILDAARIRPLPLMLPRPRLVPDGILFLLPGDPEYPAPMSALGPTRFRWGGTRWHLE